MSLIRAWFQRLFRGFKSSPARPPRKPWPTRDEILLLPSFEALRLDQIVEIHTPQAAEQACAELFAEVVVGIDTESKPTFRKGEVSTGPHVAQFATMRRAYVFQLHSEENRRAVSALMASPQLQKVGFGLNDDLRRIRSKLHTHPQAVIDVETVFSKYGYGRGVGVKVGVAIALKQRFSKPQKISTSNWMNRRLTDRQILYAANDAYAAMRVFDAMRNS